MKGFEPWLVGCKANFWFGCKDESWLVGCSGVQCSGSGKYKIKRKTILTVTSDNDKD